MAELTLTSQGVESLKPLIEGAIAESIRLTESGIQKTRERLAAFEMKYKLSTDEFLTRYENDELEETLDLDEWIGESRMLQRLEKKIARLKDIQFAD